MRNFYINRPAYFILLHCLVWWVMTICAKSALDGNGDMAEVYFWSQHWLLGSDKHPQFLPWMTKLWFMVAPKTVEAFYLLSAVNLAVSMLGILALAKVLKFGELQTAVALVLSTLAFPYLTLPQMLNMNAICLSVWPWMAWSFIKATEREASHRIAYGVLFGVLSAIGMLSKYSAIVLILPLFLYSFLPSQRWVWRTAAPWLAIVAFLVVLAPHIVWLLNHQEAIGYAKAQGADDPISEWLYYLFEFSIIPLIYWPVPIILAVVLLASGGIAQRLAALLRWREASGILLVLTLGPWLTTIFFSLIGLVELSTPWGIPVGFTFTLFLVLNADPQKLAQFGPQLVRAGYGFIWPLMLVAGLGVGIVASAIGYQGFYRPDAEAAKAVHEYWKTKSGEPLRWAAASDDASLLAFFSTSPLEALPTLPDQLPSYYPPITDWKRTTGVVFCSLEPSGQVNTKCLDQTVAWASAAGMKSEVAKIEVARSGFRFFRHIPFELAVVYVKP